MDARLAIDSAVLLLYFVVIISIGLRMGRKEDNLEDFALGGRRIPWWAVFASIIAAETSAGTFFGTPGEGFALRNYTYIQLAFGTILARILVSYIFIKPYYDYKVFSIYEYLTARFGVATKNAASAVFMFTRVLASGARLYVAAIALVLAYEMIRGTRPGQTETLLIYIGATVVIVILTAIYTTIGGIKAVVWTDFIQASIMMGSALVALGLLYSAIPGGWHKIVELHDFVPASGNRAVKQAERDQCTAHHDGSLNEIGPNDRLDSADGSVDRSENDDYNGRADINKKSFSLPGPRAANHFISEHERDRGDVKPCARSEHAGEHENGGRGILGRDAKPRGQIFVDRENFVIVV